LLSQKVLLNFRATRLPAETGNRRPKSARSATHSIRIASFHPFAVLAGPHCLGAFSFWKQGSCWCWTWCQNSTNLALIAASRLSLHLGKRTSTVGPVFALLAALDSPEEQDNDQVIDTGIFDTDTDTEHASEHISMHITTTSTVHNDDPLLTDSAGASDMSTSTLAHFLNNR
jgi:hypothetical protein